MNYDFFAAQNDVQTILDFIFSETDLILYELNSANGKDIRSFQKTEDVLKVFNFSNRHNPDSKFQLWSPKFKGDLVFQKIELNPLYCKGHTFRYSTEGWGLIQLYFGRLHKNILESSTLQLQSEKRALIWESTYKYLGAVNKWDWKEVQSTARKIKYQIHNKMAVKKNNGYGILKGAEAYVKF